MVENHHSGSRRALGFAVLFLLSVAFFWKLVLTDQYTWLESPDLANQVLPWMQYQAGEWHEGRFPLWAPYEWSGQPLLAQGQPSAAYPPNWLLYSLPLKRGWIRLGVLHWYYVAIHVFAAWFMYLLCRDLKRSFAASIVGGMVFAFGGYVGTVDWPQMLNGAIWAPLIWMFHLRVIRGERPLPSSLLGGFFLGMSWLSGHHQVPIFLTLAVGLSWVYFIWSDARNFRWAAAFGAIFVMTSALQTFPAWEYGHLAQRWVGAENAVGWKEPVPYFVHEHFSFQPISILGIAVPGFNFHTNAYIGIAALALAIAGISLGETYFTVVALGGLLYSLAHFGVLEGLFYSLIPMAEKARSPTMAVILFGLGMGPLVARGFDSLQDLAKWRPWRMLFWVGAGLLAFFFGLSAIRGMENLPDQRPIMTGLAAIALAVILKHQGSLSRWMIGGLIFLELTLVGPYYWPNRLDKSKTFYLRDMAQNQDVVDFLRGEPQPVRVLVDDKFVKFNFGDWHGLDVFGGYLASLSSNLLDLDTGSARTRELMGVTHWIGAKPLFENQPLLYSGAAGLSVWAMPNSLPRGWVVHAVLRADRGEMQKLLSNPRFDFRKAALADREFSLENCSGDRATMLRRDPSHVVLGVEAQCRGMLVLGELDYPGWRVDVDDRPAELVTVNGAQRGVIVERGWHRVDFRYRPASAIAGGIMTVAGSSIALAALIIGRRRT